MSGYNSGSGCGASSVLLLLLMASVALNVALLSGCDLVDPLRRKGPDGLGGKNPVVTTSGHAYDATEDLREIASRLGVEVGGKGGYEIASAIKTKLYVEPSAKGFPRDVLTEAQFEKVKKVLPDDKALIISEYHRFIKSMEGKRFVVIP